jgi:hypothetical protein
MLQSSLCAPVAAIMKAWMYRERFKVTEDYDLIVRLWKLWKLYNLPDYSLHYRVNQWLTSTMWHKMPWNGFKILLSEWFSYPWFYKALAKRSIRIAEVLAIKIAKENLSADQISYLKKMRDFLKQ